MTAKPKPFATEAALCARFLSLIGEDWTAYAETDGWDIILVRNADGFQIGVQAKLRLNTDVINQAIEDGHGFMAASPMPDCRAVLVPWDVGGGFDKIGGYIGLTIIRVAAPPTDERPRYLRGGGEFAPHLPSKENSRWREEWFELAPLNRCRLPEYVPDVIAGASAPRQLTDWKVKALKIAVTLEKLGYVSRQDFRHLDIDHRRWVTLGWLIADGARYVKGPAFPNFKRQHPIVYKQIKADSEKWMMKPEARAPEQLGLLK